MMSSQQLNKIEKMLTALLASQNHIHWIGGYAHGRTSGGDPFVILYPASDKLNIKICRVYSHDFKKLPNHVNTRVPTNVPTNKNTPTKSEAKSNGRYHVTPIFQIVTHAGRMTNTGPECRFSDTLFAGHADEFMMAAKEQAEAKRVYVGGGEVGGDNRAEVKYFDSYVEAHDGKRPFSVDSLREWRNTSK